MITLQKDHFGGSGVVCTLFLRYSGGHNVEDGLE